MHKIIITTHVEDLAKWEAGFRTRGPLFRRQTIRSVHFAMTQPNEVALCFEVDDLDKYLEILNSPETTAAMAEDGIQRENVKVYVLDKVFKP